MKKMLTFNLIIVTSLLHILKIKSFLFQKSYQKKFTFKLANKIPDEDILYQVFLDEITNIVNSDRAITNDMDFSSNKAFKKWIDSEANNLPSKLIENPTILEANAPLEVIYNKKIIFGNYICSNKNSEGKVVSIQIRKVSGEVVTVELAQVISSWDALSDEIIPENPNDWADTANDALDILRNLSPRKSNLSEFWKNVLQLNNGLKVDSLDLSIYIFQEKKFRTWINPVYSAEEVRVRVPSAAQRYAAALLLFNNELYFKRQSTLLSKPPDDEDSDTLTRDSDTWIVEGGYKVLDEGQNLFIEGEIFCKYFQERVSMKEGQVNSIDKTPFRAACITQQLRALEVYSLSPENVPPPKAIKHILKKIDKKLSPSGAAQLLKEINYSENAASKFLNRQVNSNSSTSLNGITPWSEKVLECSKLLSEDIYKRRSLLASMPPTKHSKRIPSTKMDLRSLQNEHPVICIDNKHASFFDDAFSLSPETGEIFVHVVDVDQYLKKYSILEENAKERISSIFLPSGSLHMLPFNALESLKLSSETANEVITVALSVDTEGGLIGFRIFPSIIGPVTPIDVNTADELIDGVGSEEVNGQYIATRYGFTDAIVNDLIFSQKLVSKIITRNPWVDSHFSASNSKDFRLNKRDGTYRQYEIEKTSGNRMINALLTLYSNASCEFVKAKGIDLPIIWENRDRFDSNIIRRFGTQPLRNWLAQLQQRQIRASLNLEKPLSRKECAMSVSYYNSKKKQLSTMEDKGRDQMSFEAFENHCLTLKKSGQSPIVLNAIGLGRGGVVRLKDFKLEGIVQKSLSKGEIVKVSVQKLIHETKTIYFDLVEN